MDESQDALDLSSNTLKRKSPPQNMPNNKMRRVMSIKDNQNSLTEGAQYFTITLTALEDKTIINYLREHIIIEDKSGNESKQHLITLKFQNAAHGKKIMKYAYDLGRKAKNLSRSKFCEELQAIFPDIDRECGEAHCSANGALGSSHDVQFISIEKRIIQNEVSSVIDSDRAPGPSEVANFINVTEKQQPINLKVYVNEVPGPSHDFRSINIEEKIVQNGVSSVIEVNPNNSITEVAVGDSTKLNIDDTYEYLTGIFPNADPHYLRTSAENFRDENDITTFVDNKLESNDYPTREQYSAKTKVTEDQQQYTSNFKIEQFLSVFPNPFTHFENETRKCEYSVIVVEFLKNEFNRVRVNTINRIYKSSKFNMSVSAKTLRLTRDFMAKPRCCRELPTENIPLLQEMAFVRNWEAIRKHMEAVKQKEEEEFNSLKAAGDLWTCQCCYDDECVASKCSTCDNAHVFCNSCIVRGTDSKLADGETHVPCFLNCGSEFSISTLQKVLPPTKFNILLKKRQAAEVTAAGLEGLVSCPFCHFASIPPEGDKVFKCLNPECMKESCIQCKQLNHVPFKCEEIRKKDTARKFIEEKMTQALTRTCYQCKKVFFKEEGCNKMTCPCGAMMCYICNKPIKDYMHFEGQGPSTGNKCPLWTDNKLLNAETVRKVEEDARRKLLQEDPTLDIGTKSLSPALPPPTARPHLGIPHQHNIIANMLAARVLNEGDLDLQ